MGLEDRKIKVTIEGELTDLTAIYIWSNTQQR